MRQINFALAVFAAAVLTACGGSDNNSVTTPAAPKFASQTVFGDSLSDVGTYGVGTVAALGGGKFTINGNNTAINAALTGKNWTELLAAQIGVAAPCPAVTGLEGDPASGLRVPIVENLNCTNYAQGGSRISNPLGTQNKATNPTFGALTYPVSKQIAMHLARKGTFKADELVVVFAGGNEILALLTGLKEAAGAAGAKAGNETFAKNLTLALAAGATNPSTAAVAIGTAIATEAARPGSTSATLVGAAVQAAATQPGNSAVASPAVYGPMVAKAQADAAVAGTAAGNAYASANGPALVPQMAALGAELAGLVRTQIVAKGATRVALVNLPDVSVTPYARAESAATQQLIAGMVSGFNIALRVGIDGLEDKVQYVDLATTFADNFANPAKYGISNVTTPACGLSALGDSSVACSGKTIISAGVGTYLFADTLHPTPFGYTFIAKAVADSLSARGWI
ncbi:MAG: esterase [Pseudomonadota bacterium]